MQLRNILTPGIALSVLVLFASVAEAQQSRRNVSSSEKLARTQWSPSRPSRSGIASADENVRQASHQARGSVRRVQAEGELPVPKPLPEANTKGKEQSVLQPAPAQRVQAQPAPMHEDYEYSEPMDGEIIYDSAPYSGDIVSENYGCDSGSCDSGSCDSMGCVGQCGGTCRQCCEGAWRPCMTLCFPQDGWVAVDYLNWRQKGMFLPPLVTTSTNNNVGRDAAGVLGVDSTQILFGNERVLDGSFNGLRLNFGFWLDGCRTWGIGADMFDLEEESLVFSRTSSGAAGSQILARPFFNVAAGQARQDSELVAFPNVVRGTISAEVTSDLAGASVYLLHRGSSNEFCGTGLVHPGPAKVRTTMDWLIGYRYMQLSESVGITENLTSLLAAPDNGTFVINDSFRTRNQFNGIDLGVNYNRYRNRWGLNLLAKLALGNTNQVVNINGSTTLNGALQTSNGQNAGFLAQPSNIGSHQRDQFAVIPELGATASYFVTPRFSLRAGYTFIYWSNVVRPGEHIDTDVNTALLPPANGVNTNLRPRFDFDSVDYYAHGVNLGAQFTW